MSDPRVELVARSYDEIADRLLEWAQRVDGDPRVAWLEKARR